MTFDPYSLNHIAGVYYAKEDKLNPERLLLLKERYNQIFSGVPSGQIDKIYRRLVEGENIADLSDNSQEPLIHTARTIQRGIERIKENIANLND